MDTYNVMVRLRHFAEMLTREILLKVTFDKPLLPVILEMAGREPYASDSWVGLHRIVILMHRETEREEYFEALQRYIGSRPPPIPKSAWNEILVSSQNYHTGKFNQGKENFLWKIWEIYQKMIAYDVIYEGEYIRPGLLKNIVTVGIRLNQLEAAEKVVDSFGQRVEPRIREGVLGYNKAVLAFARRDYRQALRLLSQAQVDDIFYELGTRALFLKLFYELEDAVSFYHHWDAFYNFIRRNKVMSDAQKASHKNFIRIIRQLMRIRAEGDRNLGMKLREEIERQGVLDSTWFHKKLDELKIPRP
ncbi:MAG: hypothetical protein N2050_00010 [Flavobacteriales bacterium]|nr:hypothetical protein [Flavobacteriales bacterium]